jgi:hypothetical protein
LALWGDQVDIDGQAVSSERTFGVISRGSPIRGYPTTRYWQPMISPPSSPRRRNLEPTFVETVSVGELAEKICVDV